MSLVEKNLTAMNFERAQAAPEFEKRNETEQKLIPQNPELVAATYKEVAYPIEQIYLSNPFDDSSLRVRADYRPEGIKYTATLKTAGEIVDEALKRTEVETPISAEAFAYYQSMNLPTVHKLRAKLGNGVTIDFYDETAPVPVLIEVEGEDKDARAKAILELQNTIGELTDRSDDKSLTNEAMAYTIWESRGNELPESPEKLEAFVDRVVEQMVANFAIGKNQVVTGLTGMSGSGKTTATNAIRERIVEVLGKEFEPVVVSTDDYHFGKKALEAAHGAPYSAWDHPQTYNTKELAYDLSLLAEGQAIFARHFDFQTEEVVFDDTITPSPFVLIEGLYAGSSDLKQVRDLHFELPTSLATCIERDIRRLIIDGRANGPFPTPEHRLRYQMENAIPLYLEQEKPHKPGFSASVRLMAERAFMLGRVEEVLARNNEVE